METMESLLSPRKHEYLALGLMSGTSADGVTGALVRFVIQEEHFEDQILEFITVPYPKDLRQKIFRLFRDEAGSLRLVCELNFEIGQFFGKVAQRVIFNSGIPKDAIHVIGSHGQTVYHLPPGQKELKKYAPSTLQIGEASVISQMTGVPVASDFRTADIAAGGHGAPLIAAADF
ncbi:MAG TPA: anhydro-N-acetylmuramic acid kinase, partial [Candidatus Sumerlaeota bacterium]|nr:anhydro-N-acetylmuramic acid kinase [Candidatus Sumerlaeota bacterium]